MPMLELMDLLRSRGFRVFIVTGGGVEFVRAIGDELYGVADRRRRRLRGGGRGSSAATGGSCWCARRRCSARPNEGEPKAVNIQAHIGRRPVFAAGNSAGDTEMLEYTHTGERPRCAWSSTTTTTEREYAYAGSR